MPEIIDQFTDIISQQWVHSIFWAVVIGIATLALARIVTRALRHALNRDSNPLPSASIIINIGRAAVLIAGGSIILDACFGINANALIAALGVGGIAVSLGFQDTLSNLIGGMQVTFMGIIKPGDNIEVGSSSGVVQDITWRHTTIKDTSGQVVVIPNSVISKTALVHLLPANRVIVPFAVARTSVSTLTDTAAAAPLSMNTLSVRLAVDAKRAADGISPVIDGPNVYFSEITELGIKGKIVFQIEDASMTGRAADAVIRAIAPTLE